MTRTNREMVQIFLVFFSRILEPKSISVRERAEFSSTLMAISRGKHLSLTTFSSFSSQSSKLSSSSHSNEKPQDETLISSVVSILREQRSKSRWNFIKTLHPNGFSPNECSQITLNLRNNPRLALRFFLWSEKKSLCTHDLLSYSTIIHILARGRLKTLAKTLIQKAIRVSESNSGNDSGGDQLFNPPKIFETLTKTYRTCDSAPFVFDLLIRACLESKKIDSTLMIVRMLRSRSIYPKASTCNSLIRAVSKLRGSDAGLDIFKEIFGLDEGVERKVVRVSPNVQTFNTLMLCFYQDGMMEKVEEIWFEMETLNCVPNLFSYSILMAAFCDEGKMAEAIELWEEMRKKQIKPDSMAYNTLIQGFCNGEELERAEELFREMELSEIEASCLTYEHLIKGYCRIGNLGAVILLYKEMCRKDLTPEASTVNEVIGEMCNKKRVSEGLEFFRNVMKRGSFFPSETSYEFLIKGLCEEGRMEEALMLQAEMVGKGFEPNLEVYGAFIEGYIKLGDEEKARKLRTEMLEIYLQQKKD